MLYLCIVLGGIIATLLFVLRNLCIECDKIEGEKIELQYQLDESEEAAGLTLQQLHYVEEELRRTQEELRLLRESKVDPR